MSGSNDEQRGISPKRPNRGHRQEEPLRAATTDEPEPKKGDVERKMQKQNQSQQRGGCLIEG